MTASALEIVCPAGTPGALEAAVDAGADAVYLGFRDATNARNFPGLNFSRDEVKRGLTYAHQNACKIYLAINTFPSAGAESAWHRAVDDAAGLGVDAVILADIGLLNYAATRHPSLRRHLSVQASAAHPLALDYYARSFGIRRAVLPRILTLPQIAAIASGTSVEIEVFVYGGMCPMAEGRCSLSSYVTGQSPNMSGICSPPSHVRYVPTSRGTKACVGAFTINEFERHEQPGYPTLCKGRFRTEGHTGYLFEDPVSLDARPLIPEFMAAGVKALKIEGRQRGRAYVGQVVAAVRTAADTAAAGASPDAERLPGLNEGGRETRGAYRREWR